MEDFLTLDTMQNHVKFPKFIRYFETFILATIQSNVFWRED